MKTKDILTVLSLVVAVLTLGGMETNDPVGKALIVYWVVLAVCFLSIFICFFLPIYWAAKKDREHINFDPRCVVDSTPGRHSGLRRR